MEVVAFLQNPYSAEYAWRPWPRKLWLEAFKKSRSGKRLELFEGYCGKENIWWDNTTAVVAPDPRQVLPADIEHIKKTLKRRKPELVLTFGKQAGEELMNLYKNLYLYPYLKNVPLIIMPHPTYRVVTTELFHRAGVRAKESLQMRPYGNEVYEYKQTKEKIVIIRTEFN